LDGEERLRRILVKARQDGRVEVGSLALELKVAAETVRRDLRTLVDRGVLQRVHGGAVPVESAGFELSLAHRVASHASERRRIAVAAAQRLHGAETPSARAGDNEQHARELAEHRGAETALRSGAEQRSVR
jgi:DeoR family transcriptional regulator, fructose operon transcriptional repressor